MLHHISGIRIVRIKNTCLAECKQLCFPVAVFLKACVLIWSDMILRQVCEDTIIKIHACYTV